MSGERGSRTSGTELTSEIIPAERARADLIDAMYALYREHYAAVTLERFADDLADKAHVLIVRDAGGEMRGFSTLAVTKADCRGTPLRAIFSGDTIMHRDYWGHQSLAFAWIRFAGSVKAQAPGLPLYWFLITKGHRTYRYLSAFSVDFYPRWDRPTPDPELEIMRMLAKQRFGRAFDEARGVIHYPVSRGHLRAELASVGELERRRDDVRFFLERNPDYAQGDELVCLTELSAENLKPIARRLFAKGLGD
jgi:hypothetical protein